MKTTNPVDFGNAWSTGDRPCDEDEGETPCEEGTQERNDAIDDCSVLTMVSGEQTTSHFQTFFFS